MPDLSAAELLDLWQAAEPCEPVERALALAAAVDPPAGGVEGLARLPLGRRDALLLELHESLAGSTLEATARCPECGEQAEFALATGGLGAGAPAGPASPLERDGFVVSWRPPCSEDAAAAARAGDAASAERVLLERCVTAARGPGGEIPAAALPVELRAALAACMAEADPLAEVLVDVSCPACDAGFVADLDTSVFVWAELCAHAQRLLREVDVLARAYGWSEPEVLALEGRRRAAYLELAREREAWELEP